MDRAGLVCVEVVFRQIEAGNASVWFRIATQDEEMPCGLNGVAKG
jgi:hypothetical protein